MTGKSIVYNCGESRLKNCLSYAYHFDTQNALVTLYLSVDIDESISGTIYFLLPSIRLTLTGFANQN